MRRATVRVVLTLLLVVAVAGCVVYGRPAPGVAFAVGFPPPPLRADVVVEAPAPGLVWVGGYWTWSAERHDYVWIPGRWVRAPFPGARWVPPHWEKHEGQLYFYHGHWR
jgi:hypothetical protein